MTSEKDDSILRQASDKQLTRRNLLGGAAVVGAAAAFAPAIAACGSSSSGGGTTTSASPSGAAASPVKGGNLRLGVTGGSTRDVLDAHVAYSNTDNIRGRQMFDTLMSRDHEFKIQNALAEEVTPNADATVWTVRVRPDVTFHNGKTLGADDVIWTFQKILDPKFPNNVSDQLVDVDPKRLKKLDARTVEITLKRPNAVMDDIFSFSKLTIKPVDFDVKNPVGTGPFAYKTFIPGDRSILTAYPNYWGVGPYVDQVETIDFADGSAQVNALLGGQVDAIGDVPAGQVTTVQSGGNSTVISDTGRFNYLFWRVDLTPWSDVRVRQAMRLIMDRNQMVELALNGYGNIGNDMWSYYDPAYPKDFPQRAQDIEQAKSLLKQAGQENLSFVAYTSNVASGMVESTQIFAQQAKAAGVTAKVVKVDPGIFWGDKYLTWPNGCAWYSARLYLTQARLMQAWNEPHWEDPTWKSLVNQAFKTVDPTRRNDVLRQIYKIDYDQGPWDIWAYSKLVDAKTSKVNGLVADASGISFNAGYVNELWLT
jgi:peptide/nickel transport system substrate-binding protein